MKRQGTTIPRPVSFASCSVVRHILHPHVARSVANQCFHLVISCFYFETYRFVDCVIHAEPLAIFSHSFAHASQASAQFWQKQGQTRPLLHVPVTQQQSRYLLAWQLSSSPNISPPAYLGISRCRRCGSSPSHSGFWAVPSNMDVVLNGSKSPRAAASAVFDNKDRTSSSLIGRNVRAASHA